MGRLKSSDFSSDIFWLPNLVCCGSISACERSRIARRLMIYGSDAEPVGFCRHWKSMNRSLPRVRDGKTHFVSHSLIVTVN